MNTSPFWITVFAGLCSFIAWSNVMQTQRYQQKSLQRQQEERQRQEQVRREQQLRFAPLTTQNVKGTSSSSRVPTMSPIETSQPQPATNIAPDTPPFEAIFTAEEQPPTSIVADDNVPNTNIVAPQTTLPNTTK